MHLSYLTLCLVLSVVLTGVRANSDAQGPICRKPEKLKKPPAVPRCGLNHARPKLQSNQCAVTYRCKGHCGVVTVPHLGSKSMDCDYAEVTVGPDGKILDQCCDPPECPNGCPSKPNSCVNDQYGCPAINGTIQRFGDKSYIYHCNSAFCPSIIISVSTTETLKECAEKCSKDPDCKYLSHHKKTCTLAVSLDSMEKMSGGIVLEPVTLPTLQNSECSRLDKTRQVIKGMEFLLHCDTRLADAATCPQNSATSYEECAAQCAADANCITATFAAGRCCLSDRKSGPSKQSGAISVEPLPGYGCPYVDWAVKEIGGVRYEYQCDAWLESSGQWTLVQAVNEVDCALQCSKFTPCTGVSLRGQQCYLATGPTTLRPKGNWVALVPVKNQANAHSTIEHHHGNELQVPECRAAHDLEIKYHGHAYKVDCFRYVGSDGFVTATKPSLADCIKLCADYKSCVALHYIPHQQLCALHDNIPRVGSQGDFGVSYVRRIS
ncbi:hypothetical protein BDV25DRAFT_129205 [Aspergillus avenaceus]|uniref:Apple domain-containing protein n=1 Tax=Aspergillus avenaceus TaxID=36643 RepID=A0A5N6TWV5_ASPAV|nr:hypothetical protein BDV25DRAFT_129205 [Aspergillus avenaceus]